MLNEKIIQWYSDNGKWFIQAKLYDQIDCDVTVRKIVSGKKKTVRSRDLPDYIKKKVNELREEIKNA